MRRSKRSKEHSSFGVRARFGEEGGIYCYCQRVWQRGVDEWKQCCDADCVISWFHPACISLKEGIPVNQLPDPWMCFDCKQTLIEEETGQASLNTRIPRSISERLPTRSYSFTEDTALINGDLPFKRAKNNNNDKSTTTTKSTSASSTSAVKKPSNGWQVVQPEKTAVSKVAKSCYCHTVYRPGQEGWVLCGAKKECPVRLFHEVCALETLQEEGYKGKKLPPYWRCTECAALSDFNNARTATSSGSPEKPSFDDQSDMAMKDDSNNWEAHPDSDPYQESEVQSTSSEEIISRMVSTNANGNHPNTRNRRSAARTTSAKSSNSIAGPSNPKAYGLPQSQTSKQSQAAARNGKGGEMSAGPTKEEQVIKKQANTIARMSKELHELEVELKKSEYQHETSKQRNFQLSRRVTLLEAENLKLRRA